MSDTDKQSAENGGRSPSGQFLPGNPGGPGRRKGSANVLTMGMKEALMESFWEVGGVGWLVKLAETEPRVYASLLLRLLPPTPAEAEAEDGRGYIDPDEEESLQ